MRLRILLVLAFAIIAPLAARAQNISTVAGGGPINLPKASASIGAPVAVRQDSLGNTYILDNDYGRVYRVDHTTGNMSVFAGNGVVGFSGDGGPAVDAEMDGPSGMCLDANDNVFVADSDNAVIREIPVVTGGGKTALNIYTVAGVETETNYIYGGDGAPALSANLHFPDGCSFDSHGNLYIADRGNNAIRVVIGASATAPVGIGPVTAGNIYLFAGSLGAVPPAPPVVGYGANGAAAIGAGLNGPFDVFVDSHDNVFIGDLGNPGPTPNNVVREVPATAQVFPFAMVAGHIYTVAGVQGSIGHTTGVLATLALLNGPEGIFVDTKGNLFFADTSNQVIREVAGPTPGTGMTAGFIYDVAGTAGTHGYSGDGGTAITASLTFPAGTFVDSTGSIFISDANSNAIRQVTSGTGDYTTETISTFAGNGHFAYGGDGAPAIDGELNLPAGISVDTLGNLIIADAENSLIRKVATPISTGNLLTLTGKPEDDGFSGDGSPALGSVVNIAMGVFTDPFGNVFIADTSNCLVRKITGGNIVTVAGTDPTTTPVCGFAGATGPATAATLGHVNGVALDAAGDVFFSDSTNNIVWEVAKNTTATMTAGHIYVAVGTPGPAGYSGDGAAATAAQLNSPTGISFDVFGNLFIADTLNNVIREVPANNTTNPSPMTAGDIYTVAGDQGAGAGYTGDTGPATSATMNNPFTIVVDNADDIFIADTKNQVIREVFGATVGGFTAGDIYTVAGTGTADFGGDGGPATAADLNNPEGLALDGAGDLLLADSANNRVRSIAGIANVSAVAVASFDQTSLTFLPQPLNIASHTQVVNLRNSGGATLTGIAISIAGADPGDFSQTNTCAGTLTAGLSCAITVTFKPTVIGARSATVSVADSSLGSPQVVTLSGNGIAGAPADVLSPNPLAFTTGQLVGTASTPQNITLSNATGTAPLTIPANGIAIGGTNAGDFSQTNNCGTTVAVGASCSIMVTFKPTSATPAARTATLTLTDNAADSGQMVTLTGTAVAPADVLSPSPLVFATPQIVGTASTPQNINLSNATGTAPLSIPANGIAIGGANAGDFSQTNNCGTSVAVGASCTISVTFKPTSLTPAARTATLTLTDNAADSGQMVTLTGTAVAPADVLSPNPLVFATAQTVGTASTPQNITLSNATGTAALTITANGIAIGGTNAGDFSQTNNCGTSVAVGASCTIMVTFNPTSATPSARTATLTLTDNAADSGQMVTLTGTAVAAAPAVTLSNSAVTFADQFVGSTSAPAPTITLTNSGTAALNIASVTLTGANPGDYAQTNTCSGTAVAANGGKCTITVTFTPTTTGARPASITVTDNAATTTQTITLGGNGFNISLVAAASSSLTQTIKAGQAATWAVQLNTTGGAPTDTVNVTLACSGAPALTTLNCPATEAAPGSFNITAATTGTGMLAPQPQSEPKMQLPSSMQLLPLTIVALLLCLAAMLAWMQSPAGRMRTVSVALTACLVLLPMSATTFLAGCASSGGSSSTPTPESAPTITTQPTNQTAPVGQTATFAVVAAGTAPLTYQWQKNGTAINGATSASYTTPSTTVADNGSTFAVVVSNAAGNATSNAAKLSLSTPSATYTIMVTMTVSGAAPQTAQLTLIVQ